MSNIRESKQKGHAHTLVLLDCSEIRNLLYLKKETHSKKREGELRELHLAFRIAEYVTVIIQSATVEIAMKRKTYQ